MKSSKNILIAIALLVGQISYISCGANRNNMNRNAQARTARPVNTRTAANNRYAQPVQQMQQQPIQEDLSQVTPEMVDAIIFGDNNGGRNNPAPVVQQITAESLTQESLFMLDMVQTLIAADPSIQNIAIDKATGQMINFPPVDYFFHKLPLNESAKAAWHILLEATEFALFVDELSMQYNLRFNAEPNLRARLEQQKAMLENKLSAISKQQSYYSWIFGSGSAQRTQHQNMSIEFNPHAATIDVPANFIAAAAQFNNYKQKKHAQQAAELLFKQIFIAQQYRFPNPVAIEIHGKHISAEHYLYQHFPSFHYLCDHILKLDMSQRRSRLFQIRQAVQTALFEANRKSAANIGYIIPKSAIPFLDGVVAELLRYDNHLNTLCMDGRFGATADDIAKAPEWSTFSKIAAGVIVTGIVVGGAALAYDKYNGTNNVGDTWNATTGAVQTGYNTAGQQVSDFSSWLTGPSQAEKDRIAAEQQAAANKKIEDDRIALENARQIEEKEKQEALQAEQDRIAAEQKLAADKAEQERIEKERLEIKGESRQDHDVFTHQDDDTAVETFGKNFVNSLSNLPNNVRVAANKALEPKEDDSPLQKDLKNIVDTLDKPMQQKDYDLFTHESDDNTFETFGKNIVNSVTNLPNNVRIKINEARERKPNETVLQKSLKDFADELEKPMPPKDYDLLTHKNNDTSLETSGKNVVNVTTNLPNDTLIKINEMRQPQADDSRLQKSLKNSANNIADLPSKTDNLPAAAPESESANAQTPAVAQGPQAPKERTWLEYGQSWIGGNKQPIVEQAPVVNKENEVKKEDEADENLSLLDKTKKWINKQQAESDKQYEEEFAREAEYNKQQSDKQKQSKDFWDKRIENMHKGFDRGVDLNRHDESEQEIKNYKNSIEYKTGGYVPLFYNDYKTRATTDEANRKEAEDLAYNSKRTAKQTQAEFEAAQNKLKNLQDQDALLNSQIELANNAINQERNKSNLGWFSYDTPAIKAIKADQAKLEAEQKKLPELIRTQKDTVKDLSQAAEKNSKAAQDAKKALDKASEKASASSRMIRVGKWVAEQDEKAKQQQNQEQLEKLEEEAEQQAIEIDRQQRALQPSISQRIINTANKAKDNAGDLMDDFTRWLREPAAQNQNGAANKVNEWLNNISQSENKPTPSYQSTSPVKQRNAAQQILHDKQVKAGYNQLNQREQQFNQYDY